MKMSASAPSTSCEGFLIFCVIRIREGNTEWVNVQTGELDGKLIEVFGDLRDGDEVAVRGTDELRPGGNVVTKQSSADSKAPAK